MSYSIWLTRNLNIFLFYVEKDVILEKGKVNINLKPKYEDGSKKKLFC